MATMDTTTTATNVGGADVTAATTAATTTTQGKGSLLAYTGFHPVPPLPLASTISTYMHREDQHSWSHTQSVLNPTTAAASASNQTNNGGGGLNNNKRKHEALEGENAASSSLVVPPATGAATATATAAAVGVGAGEAVANADDKRGRNTVVIHPGSRWLRIGRASDILPVSVPHVIARWTKNPKRPVVFKCGVRRPTPLRPDEEDEPLLQQQQEALLQEGEEEEDGEGEDEMEQDGGGDDEEEENEDGLKRKKGKGDAMEKSEGEDGDAEEEGGGGAAQAAGGGDDTEEEKIDEGTARIDGLKAAFKDRLKIYQYRYQKGAAESAVNFNRAQTKKKNGGAETIADHNDLQRITWITSSSTTTNTTTAGTTSGAGAGTGGAKRTTAFFGHDVFLLSDSVMKEYEVRWPLRGMRFNCDKREDVQGVLNDLVDIWTAALVNELEIKRSQFKTMSAVLVVPDLADRIYIKELVQLLLVEMGFKQVAVHQESVCATYGAQLSNACVVDIGAAKTSICCVEDGLILPDTRITLNVAGDDITEAYYVLLQRSCFPYKEIDLTRLYDWNLLQDLKHATCTFDLDISGARWFDVVVRRPEQPTLKYHFKMYDEYMTAPMVLTETSAIWFAEKRKRWRPVWNLEVQEDLSNAPVEEITYAMKLSTDHILKDIAAETAAVLAQQAAMDVDSKETNSDTAKPTILDIPSRKRVVKSYRTESPPLVLPEDMVFPGGLPIDIPFETSKLPLDVAIFNSTRAASETATLTVVTKFLQNTLLIGGTSQTPEIDVYLFYRLRAIASAFYQTEVPRENIRIVQKPKELDPRIIIWKGASVLARLETSSEFWVTQRDWDRLGIRAFRDRSLFM